MEKEWAITLDVPAHYEDDTFTVDGLILGMSFGMFKMDKLPIKAQEKVREEMKRRGRFGDTGSEPCADKNKGPA